MRRVLVLILFCAGCGGGSSDPDAGAPDAAADAMIDAAACPTIDMCGWLEVYQQEIVGKLSGHREIAPGVTLTARASLAQRMTTRTFLVDELTRLGYTPMQQAYSPSGANVIATLPPTTGTGPAIVVGAHFDGVAAGPAAADNATGVAVVLAGARYLANAHTTRPIIFALFDEEEIGLVGSGAYADALVAAGTPVLAVHNFDMISFDGDGDRAIELWSPTPSLDLEYRNVASPVGIAIQPVPFQYSDHQSFLDRGFVTAGVSEEFVGGDFTPHYHRASDTYDKVNFTYLGRVTSVAITVVEVEAAY